MNKFIFTAKSMFYEHSYEHYSLIFKLRRGEEVDGIYKFYSCTIIFSRIITFVMVILSMSD